MRRTTGIYGDPQVELAAGALLTAKAAARRAARESRRSFRTARGQYRRYRDTAGVAYLDWPRWHAEYLREYRKGLGSGSGNAWGGMPSGGEVAGGGGLS